MTESMRSSSEREDVGNLLQSVSSVYESTVAERVDNIKEALKPTLYSLDDRAFNSLQLAGEQINETKKAYVDPVTDKISETRDTTVKAYDQLVETTKSYAEPVIQKACHVKEETNKVYRSCIEIAVQRKESYVDPVVRKVSDTKQATFEFYDSCTKKVEYVRRDFVAPNVERANMMYADYVAPSFEQAASVHEDYVKPTASFMLKTACHPITTYNECIQLGFDTVEARKQAVLEVASDQLETLNAYLIPLKKKIEYALEIDLDDTAGTLKATSVKLLDHGMTYARNARAKTMVKLQEGLVNLQQSLHARLSEAYPNATEIIERSITTLIETTRVAVNIGAEVASRTISSGLAVYSFSIEKIDQSRNLVNRTTTFISSTTVTGKQQVQSFVRTHEDNIWYLAKKVGVSSYLGIIGLQEKEKTW